MTAIDGTRDLARVVHDLEDRVDTEPTRRAPWPLQVEEVLALCATLRAAGYDVGTQVDRIDAINAAIDAMLTADPLADIDLLTADPADVAERVRRAGVNRATHLEIANIRNGFQHQLARAAADDLRAASDGIVRGLRKRFDPAAKVIKAAAAAGLTEHSDTEHLLKSGSAEQIEAYRSLATAVAQLDDVFRLRNQLTTIANVGPSRWPLAAFVTNVGTADDLESAHGVWRGEVEVVQHDIQPPTGWGSHLANVRRKRLGGAWLPLVCAGFDLKLNTGAEAQAVVDAAMRGIGR